MDQDRTTGRCRAPVPARSSCRWLPCARCGLVTVGCIINCRCCRRRAAEAIQAIVSGGRMAKVRAISRARWDALAAYCRKPLARALSQELAWFEAEGERVLATLIVDPDGEFSGIILARDRLER